MAPPRKPPEPGRTHPVHLRLPTHLFLRLEAKAKAEGLPFNRVAINELGAFPHLDRQVRVIRAAVLESEIKVVRQNEAGAASSRVKRRQAEPKAERPVARMTYSIREFCEAHGISVDTYFRLQRIGEGPRAMKVGGRTLISLEAANAWRRKRAVTAEKAAAE